MFFFSYKSGAHVCYICFVCACDRVYSQTFAALIPFEYTIQQGLPTSKSSVFASACARHIQGLVRRQLGTPGFVELSAVLGILWHIHKQRVRVRAHMLSRPLEIARSSAFFYTLPIGSADAVLCEDYL